jgi:putative ABC transport system substrate-binding protein
VDLLPELATELVRLKVDCIVTNGANATRAAKQATDAIPIVMQNVSGDPVRNGLIASLARPGGNVTGFTNMNSELAGKRLELLKETVPKSSRFAILWDPNSLAAVGQLRVAEIAARALGVQLQSLEVRNHEDLEEAFRAAAKGRAQALVVAGGGITNSHQARIVGLAVKTRLPVTYSNSTWVAAGGLMSYSTDSAELYRRSASYVDRILKGTKPADLPVQQPTKFEFVINLNAAKQIGLKIPPNVLARADKVIE